jgi:hypothetical protein
MLFIPFQEVVAGILDHVDRRAPNHVCRPASSTEPVHKPIRLFPEQLQELSNEFHEHRANGSHQAPQLSSERRVEIFLASGGFY